MITVESSVFIPVPLDEVTAFVSDVANDPKWNPEVLGAERAPPDAAATSIDYHVRLKPFMGISSCTMRVSADAETHITKIAGSPIDWIDALATYTFEPVDGGTRVTRHCDIKVKGMMRLMEPLMRIQIRKKKNEMLAGLAAYYERSRGE